MAGLNNYQKEALQFTLAQADLSIGNFSALLVYSCNPNVPGFPSYLNTRLLGYLTIGYREAREYPSRHFRSQVREVPRPQEVPRIQGLSGYGVTGTFLKILGPLLRAVILRRIGMHAICTYIHICIYVFLCVIMGFQGAPEF